MASARSLFLITMATATVCLWVDIAGSVNHHYSTTELTNGFWTQCSGTPFLHPETFDCAHSFLASLATTAWSVAQLCQREHSFTTDCHDGGESELFVYGDVNEYNTPNWNCSSCLQRALQLLRSSCRGMTGGHVYLDAVPRCSVRFEINDFRR